jgi:hypothetical protein
MGAEEADSVRVMPLRVESSRIDDPQPERVPTGPLVDKIVDNVCEDPGMPLDR